MTAKKMMEKARSLLVMSSRFYGHLALQLVLVEDLKCKTAWTDGKSLGYNPEWVMKQTIPQLIGVNAHEVKHCAFGHHIRRNGRDKKEWNVAGDYVVNSMDDYELPDGALIDVQYDGMSADEVFSKIHKEPDPDGEEEEKGKDKDDSDGGKSEDKDDSQGDNSDDDSDDDSDPGNSGEVRDATNEDGDSLNKTENAKEEAKWKVAVAQAKQLAQSAGEGLSPGLTRSVDELLNPTIEWRILLQRLMTEVAKNEYTWQRPNRRFLWQGLYFPSAHNNELGTMVFGIDTSISMNVQALNRSTSELKYVVEMTKAESYVIHCDNKIHKVEHFEDGHFPEKFEPVGGGGTDFRPVFEWIEDEMIEPTCLVYFTDLEGTYPDEEPPYPVIWLCTKKNPYKTPNFGYILHVI